MTQLVSIQQAGRNALAAWLTTELASVTGGVTVEPRWFENDRPLSAKAISIIDAGPRQTEWLQTEILATTNVDVEGITPVKKVDAVWNFGFITQPIQLDVWARSDPELDDIIGRLDASLNKGTLGIGVANADLFSAGLLLNLANGWAPGTVDFAFGEALASPAPSSVVEGEWRAMYRGELTAQLVQTARSARIARILLKRRLRTFDPIDTTVSPDTTIITINS